MSFAWFKWDVSHIKRKSISLLKSWRIWQHCQYPRWHNDRNWVAACPCRACTCVLSISHSPHHSLLPSTRLFHSVLLPVWLLLAREFVSFDTSDQICHSKDESDSSYWQVWIGEAGKCHLPSLWLSNIPQYPCIPLVQPSIHFGLYLIYAFTFCTRVESRTIWDWVWIILSSSLGISLQQCMQNSRLLDILIVDYR